MLGTYLGAWTGFRVDLGVDRSSRLIRFPKAPARDPASGQVSDALPVGRQWDWALALLLRVQPLLRGSHCGAGHLLAGSHT